MVDHKRIKASLETIHKVYRSILDDDAGYVLPEAESAIDTSWEAYKLATRNQTRGYVPEPWGYTIYHQQPLRFRPTKTPHGVELRVDVYCDIGWLDGDAPIKQDIKIRVWSEHADVIYDEDRDSPKIYDALADVDRSHKGRVVSRFHFDHAGQEQGYGPKYHFQVGGKPEAYELCWHPQKVNLPRLVHQPMELVLTCQMIAANFFYDEYVQIREKREWRDEVIFYQELLLKEYYAYCFRTVQSKGSLLDELWVD